MLRARLRHVYWLGGASGAGKSTIARRIATEHGLTVYSTDDAMADHAGRSTQHDAPYLSTFKVMDMDERWVHRSPETMLATFHWYRGESFELIVDDLLRQPARTGVIAEGFRLLPHLVKPLLADASQAVWLLPTPAFRRAAFDRRGTTSEITRKTSDPETALRNLLERDGLFTDRLHEETARLELQAVEIDTSTSEDELAAQVKGALGL